MSDDLNFQNISTVQNKLQPKPVTFVAAATVAPTTFLSFIAGTTALATITPPVTGAHLLAIVATATNWAGAVTTGNILVASVTNSTLWQNKLNLFVYDPISAKYYPSYAVHSTTT
jgi:hypothetical protein